MSEVTRGRIVSLLGMAAGEERSLLARVEAESAMPEWYPEVQFVAPHDGKRVAPQPMCGAAIR